MLNAGHKTATAFTVWFRHFQTPVFNKQDRKSSEKLWYVCRLLLSLFFFFIFFFFYNFFFIPNAWLASRKNWSVEELETLPTGAKPRTSNHRSPGGEWREKKKQSTIFLERTRERVKGPSSMRRTLELFQRRRRGNFEETGWSACGHFRAHRYHLELNWAQLNYHGSFSAAVSPV